MTTHWNSKLTHIKSLLPPPEDKQQLYESIIELGKKLDGLNESDLCEENQVFGCQSLMFIKTEILPDKQLLFTAHSDALLSSGLAYIMTYLFSGESALSILQQDGEFLNELGIVHALSPSRANGLLSIFKHIKQQALKNLSANAESLD